MKAKLENYQGALIGLAVGDALGATTENMYIEDVKAMFPNKHKDIIGGGWLKLKPGEITDDTGMTLATAKGIIRTKDIKNVISNIGREYVLWYLSIPKDIGTITYNAIYHYFLHRHWDIASRLTHKALDKRTAGNGSLMRILPVALAYHYDIELMERITRKASKMTHYDDKATEACLVYNRIAKRVIDGEALKTAIETEIQDTTYKNVLKRTPRTRPSGYVVDTFNWVLTALHKSESYEEVVVRLANLGSDSDTTCAIAGGLAGLYYGLDAIPERLKSKILIYYELFDAAINLYNNALFEYQLKMSGI